ncbi:MAG: UvrD-helicase domain-containing protein [Thermoguttaceae bacterium]|jgi:superfamily I DNA/RNA helicase
MAKYEPVSPEEAELNAAVEAILNSDSPKKLVVAGPGTGKTTLFKKMLEVAPGEPSQRIVLTFINNLKDDLKKDLGDLAKVFTLHSYCLRLLYREAKLRGSLSPDFRCCPGLASLIAEDWEFIEGSEAPQFVGEMRSLAEKNHIPFYLARGDYYDAVDFDDNVYRVLCGLKAGRVAVDSYELVLVDEYQDFNALEAGIIDLLGGHNRILIAGDDDQALYSPLRDASWDHIRLLRTVGEYKFFELPFCMRCPKVVVDAVRDVITKAHKLGKLKGRIEKPYKYFYPAKGADSKKYPKIARVETTVQSKKVNYMGRYIARAIAEIPQDEVKAAMSGGYPIALVIVAKPYRDQIITYLKSDGFAIETRGESSPKLSRETGLSILKRDRNSNIGWRIILGIDEPPFRREAIKQTADRTKALASLIPVEYRKSVIAEVNVFKPAESTRDDKEKKPVELRCVQVTSFEGAKGLSAQHVFIAGLHDGELPRDPASVKDIEICKFVVGLTRTRKKCTLVYTRHFADGWKSPSAFISWIAPDRLDFVKVDKAYWK